ncbi:MAG: hypothetical protein KAT43_04735 [Nanoarchaeota archaeon]|nr:hypothetical protein [Nanoarchaeota archaeon]
MRDKYLDRETLIHNMRMGVDKPWCGGVAKVRSDKLEEIKKGLEKVVGESYDLSVGVFEDFVYAKGIFYDWFHDRMLAYFERIEASGDVIEEAVITKAHYGYFLNVRRWIEKEKEEHFKEGQDD